MGSDFKGIGSDIVNQNNMVDLTCNGHKQFVLVITPLVIMKHIF